ncbi:hypothetical protein LPJ64_004789, partial [Coemansia asiatica]
LKEARAKAIGEDENDSEALAAGEGVASMQLQSALQSAQQSDVDMGGEEDDDL